MSDLLLELSTHPRFRQLVRGVGLPLPLPQRLRRGSGPISARPLEGRRAVMAGAQTFSSGLASMLAAAGAEIFVCGDAAALLPFEEAGQAWGRPPQRVSSLEPPAGLGVDALVFDATELESASQLTSLYSFFHAWIGATRSSSRIVLLSRPPEEATDPEAAAVRAALEGFVRSLAKEIGRRGSTSNLVRVGAGAEPRLGSLLRFLLSERSAFITGQPFRLGIEVAQAEDRPTLALEGKVALVTGAARGIGASTAARLSEEGAKVLVLDRPEDDARASRISREIGGSLILADITEPGAPSQIADAIAERYGGLDLLVHNAGVTRDRTLAKMSPARWEGALEVNLGAVLRIDARLDASGLLRDGGRHVYLSSVAGIAGNMGQTNYAASKAGIAGYVRARARQLAPRGICVNAVAPGFIETRLTAAMPVAIREAARRLSALGQGGAPEDVAEAITFLAAPGASGLTGGLVRVCGGAFVGA